MFQKVAWNFTQTLRLVHRSNLCARHCILVRLATIRHTCETHGKTYDIIHDEFFMPHHVIQNDNEIPPPQYRARQEVQNVRFVDLDNLSLAELSSNFTYNKNYNLRQNQL